MHSAKRDGGDRDIQPLDVDRPIPIDGPAVTELPIGVPAPTLDPTPFDQRTSILLRWG